MELKVKFSVNVRIGQKNWSGTATLSFLDTGATPNKAVPLLENNAAQMINMKSEAMIALQQKEYRLKIKQVAQEHPEFLDAIIEYSQVQERYVNATSAEKD